MTVDLLALSDWLTETGITHVALESTGEYWKPVFNRLEGNVQVVLVNAAQVKQVPGARRIRPMRDGLLQASFIPSPGQRERRERRRCCRPSEGGPASSRHASNLHPRDHACWIPFPGWPSGGRSAGGRRRASTWRALALPPAWRSGRGWCQATTPMRASNARAGPGRETNPSRRSSPNWPTPQRAPREPYLSALYHRLAARRGKKRAIVAVAHSMVLSAFHMLSRQEPYQD